MQAADDNTDGMVINIIIITLVMINFTGVPADARYPLEPTDGIPSMYNCT